MQRSVMNAIHPPLARARVPPELGAHIPGHNRCLVRIGQLVALAEAARVDAVPENFSLLNKQG